MLRRDWTVAHGGQLYQIQARLRATHVIVEERVDGTLRITHHGRPLTYQPILARTVKAAEPEKLPRPRQPVRPKAGHPWNVYGRFAARPHAAAAKT